MSGDPRRLLFVVNVAWFFLSHRLPIAHAAKKVGYEVHVAAGGAQPHEIERLEEAGLTFHSLDLRRSARSPLHNLTLLLQLISLYRTLRPTLVHHVTVKPVMLGTLVARGTRVPAVVNAVSGLGYAFSAVNLWRRLLRELVGWGYRFCLRHPHMAMIFQNHDDRVEFCRWTRIEQGKTVLIAGSGVDLDRFKPTPEPAGPIKVVLPARMLRDKGVLEFCEALGRLRALGLPVEGLLAGAIDLENPASLREHELRELESLHGVRWLGHCDDMPQLFSRVHIVCLPSYREGLPKVLIEAAAAGRALVTTDVPGCRDVVADGINGLLVSARQVQPLADAIARVVSDSDLRARFGVASRRLAEQQFGVERVIARTLAVYAELLRASKGSTVRHD
jgi:glycosyltransferase involved in cell wall biosynthesis